jgi:hypothetical protein
MASRSARISFAALILAAVLVMHALGHVPLEGEGNDHLDHAFLVNDPTKSWVVYDQLDPGESARYYRMDMQKGEELRLSLFIPQKNTFSPGLGVMGPGLASSGVLPPYVESVEDTPVVVLEGVVPVTPEYEPFTPSALYQITSWSMQVPETATYYIAVFGSGEGGNFGLAIGYREEFTVNEWLKVPLDTVAIHLWEGQPLFLVLAPLFFTVILGLGIIGWLIRNSRIRSPNWFGWICGIAGLLYIGGGAIVCTQMILALGKTGMTSSAILTLVFAIVPVLLGLAALKTGIKPGRSQGRKEGALMIGIGLVGFMVWAGLIIGPLIALAGGCLQLIVPSPSTPS